MAACDERFPGRALSSYSARRQWPPTSGPRRPVSPSGGCVADRPYTLLSCGMSIDGYLDSAQVKRLALSNAADFDRVDAVRAGCDAILVGAGTIRQDDPKLLIRSESRRAQRIARGRDPDLVKVTVTGGGDLDPEARFFTTGAAPKLVFSSSSAAPALAQRLGDRAEVIDGGDPVSLPELLADLGRRGI